MEVIQSIVQFILNLGPSLFLPVLMILIGLVVKMKFKDAFSSGLTLGVAFVSMNVIIGFMLGAVGPAAEAFVNNTGIQLTAIDVGWSPMAAITWAWPYAFLMFPIQIIINILMIVMKKTDTLNVDLWNVWSKIFTAVLVSGVSGSVPLGLLAGAIQVVIELKSGDAVQKTTQELTGIPGVTCTHPMLIFCSALFPVDQLLKKIPFLNKKMDAKTLKSKIGIFAENHVMGFLIGTGIGLFGGFSPVASLTVGVEAAAAMTLFPMVAKLFMQALSPLSEAASVYMKAKFPGRDFFIGLDWPFMAGRSEVWVTAIITVPIALLMAVIVPGNNILPLAGVIALGIVVPALIVTEGNLIRMIILSVLTIPVSLIVGSTFTGIITNLASSTGAYALNAGQKISWYGLETPLFRYAISHASNVINGEVIGVVLLVLWFGLWWYYMKGMSKRNHKD